MGDEPLAQTAQSFIRSKYWKSQEGRLLVMMAFIYVLSLLFMAMYGKTWIMFRGIYCLWFVSYLFLLFLILRSPLIVYLQRLKWWQSALILFGLAFLLHLPLLFQDPYLSQDIMRLERRGEFITDGKFPYRDFDVNKPPLYIWMVWLVSFPLGPNQLVYRVVFSFVNSCIPVLIYLIGTQMAQKDDEQEPFKVFGWKVPAIGWFGGAIAYALCPIVLLEAGIAGHFDPIVVVMTLLGFYFLTKDNAIVAGIFIGAGFALKLYPLFLMPFFFLTLKSWKQRGLLTLGFFIVPIAATIPIFIVEPSLMADYLSYQFVNWYTGMSIRALLERGLGLVGGPEQLAYYAVTATLVLGSFYLYFRGLLGKVTKVQMIFIVVLLCILGMVGVQISLLFWVVGSSSIAEWLLGLIGILFPLGLFVLAVLIFVGWKDEKAKPIYKLEPKKILTGHIELPMTALFVSAGLIIVLLTSAQFHPWYLLWVLPFAFGSQPQWAWPVLMMLSALQINAYPPWEIGAF